MSNDMPKLEIEKEIKAHKSHRRSLVEILANQGYKYNDVESKPKSFFTKKKKRRKKKRH